jgi:uncharacterized repeat protein (TIGR01451 family)
VANPGDTVFINEIHYDNTGTDVGEFVEIAGPAGTDLTGWSIDLYTGAGGTVYDTHALTGVVIDDEGAGFGAVSVALPIQNGDPDGIALSDGSLVQFLSYEGTFAGSGGPANGSGSTDIGVAEAGSEAVGLSLGLTGSGATYGDFTWTTGLDDSPGSINPGQAFPITVAAIHDIQAATHTSPLDGQAVEGVTGVVTGLMSNGFFMQEPIADFDADMATSEGIFVFTNAAPSVALGDAVTVAGTVDEFLPGNDATNLTITEIVSPSIVVNSTGNSLPTAISVGGAAEGNVQPPLAVIADDAVFDPLNDGLDFYESLEGMRLTITNPQAVGRTNAFGEIPIVAGDFAAAGTRTPRGGILYEGYDQANPEVLIVDDTAVNGPHPLPNVDVGDSWSGELVGILHYSFGAPKLFPSEALPAFVDGDLQPEITSLVHAADKLRVATFNFENLGGNDSDTKFDGLAAQIVDNLLSPDIVVAQEVQDNDGATNNSTTAADVTFDRIIAAIASAGGPTYAYRQISPVDDQDGGEPGGNIRVGFLFRTDTGVAFVDRPGGGSTVATDVVDNGGTPELEHSPGRIDPTNAAFNSVRKPLVGEFTFAGETFFVVGSHWNSKGGDGPLYGTVQPPVRSSEVQRLQIATVVEDFVDDVTALDPAAKVVIAGDLNDFAFSPAVQTLTSNGYTSLVTTLPANERYGYVFEGDSFVLDHILASPGAATGAEFDTVHVNAEFYTQQSDHDPSVARFSVATGPDISVAVADSPEPVSAGANITYTITATNNGPGTPTTIEIQDAIPPGTTFVSASGGSAFTPDPLVGASTGTVHHTFSGVGPGATVVMTMVVQVNPGTPAATVISNTGTATASTELGEDPDPDDNSDTEQTTVAAAAPSVSVADKTIVEGDSGTKNLVFKVSLSAPSGNEVRVRFKTIDGTATGLGSDYASRNFVLVFSPGQTSKGVIVAVKGDTVVEPNETFTVQLLQPVNATIADGTAVGRINNDD